MLAYHKSCTNCGESKPLDDYYSDKRAADGRASQCKGCQNASSKRSREKNPSRKAAAGRDWYQRNRAAKIAAARKWNEEHPERHAENSRRWREQNPEGVAQNQASQAEKHRARKVLARAVKRGDIIRPELCEACGGEGQPYEDGRSPIQGHHHDYAKPLEVEWLCRRCHGSQHREPLDELVGA